MSHMHIVLDQFTTEKINKSNKLPFDLIDTAIKTTNSTAVTTPIAPVIIFIVVNSIGPIKNIYGLIRITSHMS